VLVLVIRHHRHESRLSVRTAESLLASDPGELSVMFTSRGGRKLQRRFEHAEVISWSISNSTFVISNYIVHGTFQFSKY
jgi:hypothetical protein